MPTRVLVLIKGLGRGGAEELLSTASRHVDRDRFHYRVAYLLPWKDALVKEIEEQGTPTECLDGARGIAWVARLRALVHRERIDLIHTHSPVVAVGARVAFSKRRRPRSVYTEHNVWQRYHPGTYWSNVLTFSRSDHVFAVSDHVRDSITYPRGLTMLPMPPVETLLHGIDQAHVHDRHAPEEVRAELGIAPRAPVVGTVANLKAHKRLDVLVSAAAIVRESVPGVRFVIVGQGPLDADLRKQAHGLGLADTIVFTGFREDAQRLASAFDVFALSSEHEGLSIALIEALSQGCPAVVTGVGGLVEVMDGRCGVVVPPRSPAALADGITTLLRDDQRRDAMGAAARQRSRDFDIRHAVRRMETVYEELLS